MPHRVLPHLLPALALAVGLLLLAGCRGPQSGGLTVAGSTSVAPIAELLADRYMAEHPGRVVNVQSSGSSAGVQAALSGAAAIGMSSRHLKPDETGLQTLLMARDAIALIVHPSNPVRALTAEQVRGIFSGQIMRWEQVGGRPGAITCITREEGSGTRGAFEEMAMGKETEISSDAIVQDSMGAAQVVVAGDRNAIAYGSLGLVKPEVVVVALDGVEPTHETAVSGKYEVTRPFLLLTKGAPSAEAKAFMDYVLSSASQAVVSEEGYVPVVTAAQP